jgi:hypothetical protein
MKRIVCDRCGWSWKLSDGGKDPYVCHSCYKDNTKKYVKTKNKKMSSEAKQVKIKNNGIIYTFTKIGTKYSKIYDSENGYPIYFSYKNEKAWLSAIKKYKK